MDDNIDITSVFVDIFTLMGYEVVGIGHDGHDAVSLFQKHKPDFMCLDVMMPGMNGMEALKLIKEKDSKARVIMITADNSTNTMSELEKLNPTAIIIKPFKIEDIVKVMEDAED